VHARKVALHGALHGTTIAKAIVEVCSRHDHRLVEPGFPEGDDLEDYQDLVDFKGAGDAMANITVAEEVINNVFFIP
jgi:hypothetical protein